ncbi:MAG: twin-arginine translocase subunit TatC [Nitrospirales bacterium]|jgi:sec-independent protein translocase protein TatC|nr:MAG: twin-arginine translocase subunit TatC [Nitrospirales bacterium]
MAVIRTMSFMDHLGDLRKKITVSLIAVCLTFVASFSYSEQILEFFMFPLRYTLDFSVRKMYLYYIYQDKLVNTKLVFLAPTEGFWMNMKISLVAALILALPIIFHQLWTFVAPGLHSKEKKYVVPFVLIATFLFLVGAAFCFFIVLPFAMSFLLTYKVGDFMMPMLSVGQYVDFCLKFVLAFGAVFELPVIIVFFTRMGFVTTQTLAKNRRYSVLIAFVIAAILTPTPDIFNQTLMAVPMIVLYEVGILASRIFAIKKAE